MGSPDPGCCEHVWANEAKGVPTPVAVVLGMDPLLTVASGWSVPADIEVGKDEKLNTCVKIVVYGGDASRLRQTRRGGR